jgi:hypothetical protein
MGLQYVVCRMLREGVAIGQGLQNLSVVFSRSTVRKHYSAWCLDATLFDFGRNQSGKMPFAGKLI